MVSLFHNPQKKKWDLSIYSFIIKIFDQAIFLAPKINALKNQDSLIVKIKGLLRTKEAIAKNQISFECLELLLSKDFKQKYTPEKWFKNISNGNIQILEQTYTLKVTENKRNLIYKNGILERTDPFTI